MRSVAWLDLTADAARCWVRTATVPSRAIFLDSEHEALRPALRLEGRRLVLGNSAWTQRRLQPHLVLPSFLDRLGDPQATWRLGRHHVTPESGAKMLFQILRERLAGTKYLLISVPGYWASEQARVLRTVATNVGLDCVGILPRELLFGLEANAGESAWKHEGLVLAVDEQAFHVSVLRPSATEIRGVGLTGRNYLGRAAWRNRLIELVSLRAIAAERRDPRASPEAEQLLFNQSDDWFVPLSEGRTIQAEVYLSHRALPFRIEATAAEAAEACHDLAEAAADLAVDVQTRTVRPAGGGDLYLTAEAAALPGLAACLYAKSKHKQPVIALGSSPVSTALSLAESIAEKERAPLEFDARRVAFPVAEFTFDAPNVLSFPGEPQARAAGDK